MEWKRLIIPAIGVPVTISFSEDGVLSLCGKTGQCQHLLVRDGVVPNTRLGYTKQMLNKLFEIWDEWHLNDHRAGTPKQMNAINIWKREVVRPGGLRYEYDRAVEYLKEIGLYEDGGYRYGTEWKKEEVPDDVLKWLFTLPGTGSSYDDIFIPEIDDSSIQQIICI